MTSLAMSERNTRGTTKLAIIDVKRAHFHSPATREIYVDLPPERAEEGMCGRLRRSMYGTRDAAYNWEMEYTRVLLAAGFRQGVSTPCIFIHDERRIRVCVHGDDFWSAGKRVRDLSSRRAVIVVQTASGGAELRGAAAPAPGPPRRPRALGPRLPDGRHHRQGPGQSAAWQLVCPRAPPLQLQPLLRPPVHRCAN